MADNRLLWYFGISEDIRPMLGKEFDVAIELLIWYWTPLSNLARGRIELRDAEECSWCVGWRTGLQDGKMGVNHCQVREGDLTIMFSDNSWHLSKSPPSSFQGWAGWMWEIDLVNRNICRIWQFGPSYPCTRCKENMKTDSDRLALVSSCTHLASESGPKPLQVQKLSYFFLHTYCISFDNGE